MVFLACKSGVELRKFADTAVMDNPTSSCGGLGGGGGSEVCCAPRSPGACILRISHWADRSLAHPPGDLYAESYHRNDHARFGVPP